MRFLFMFTPSCYGLGFCFNHEGGEVVVNFFWVVLCVIIYLYQGCNVV